MPWTQCSRGGSHPAATAKRSRKHGRGDGGDDSAGIGHTGAQAMLDTFVSVGATRFDLTWPTRAGDRGFSGFGTNSRAKASTSRCRRATSTRLRNARAASNPGAARDFDIETIHVDLINDEDGGHAARFAVKNFGSPCATQIVPTPWRLQGSFAGPWSG